jgi:hypothetical protein
MLKIPKINEIVIFFHANIILKGLAKTFSINKFNKMFIYTHITQEMIKSFFF